jgi:histidinol-phosphatase (PHP family)
MLRLPGLDLSGDHHIHTRFCNHARGTMEEYVLAALEMGLQEMTFLEHLECDIVYDHRTWLTPKLFQEYFSEGQRLQIRYKGKIKVRLGVEVGYNPAATSQLRTQLAAFPFEHIGLSYHFYFDGRRHLNMVSSRPEQIQALAAIGPEQLLTDYFKGLIQACSELPCDKICHLDAALRYLPAISYTAQHKKLIEQLLLIMQAKDIALELNSSGYRLREFPYPAADILQRAAELNLLFTVGSDAHKPEHVGSGFARLQEFTC